MEWNAWEGPSFEEHQAIKDRINYYLLWDQGEKGALTDKLEGLATEQHQLRTASGKKGWDNWAEEDWSQGGGGLFLWTKEEREAPIAAATEEGEGSPCTRAE